MESTKKQLESRKAILRDAGVTYDDIARLANVSWTFVWMWMHDQRKSAKVAAAFERLTGNKPA